MESCIFLINQKEMKREGFEDRQKKKIQQGSSKKKTKAREDKNTKDYV